MPSPAPLPLWAVAETCHCSPLEENLCPKLSLLAVSSLLAKDAATLQRLQHTAEADLLHFVLISAPQAFACRHELIPELVYYQLLA